MSNTRRYTKFETRYHKTTDESRPVEEKINQKSRTKITNQIRLLRRCRRDTRPRQRCLSLRLALRLISPQRRDNKSVLIVYRRSTIVFIMRHWKSSIVGPIEEDWWCCETCKFNVEHGCETRDIESTRSVSSIESGTDQNDVEELGINDSYNHAITTTIYELLTYAIYYKDNSYVADCC